MVTDNHFRFTRLFQPELGPLTAAQEKRKEREFWREVQADRDAQRGGDR